MLKPANIHVVTRMSAGRAVAGDASHAWAKIAEADGAQDEVGDAPVVVVDP